MMIRNSVFGIEPTRDAIDRYEFPLLLQFGANWCEHCQVAQPLVQKALEEYQEIHHIMAEDGKGHPLGRSFGVKLWPTLIFIKQGQEIKRLVRPDHIEAVQMALAEIAK